MKNYNDKTLHRTQINTFLKWVEEYELIKNKKHPKYQFVRDFYAEKLTVHKKVFLKYYNRYTEGGKRNLGELLPQKRGPRYNTGKPYPFIENQVIQIREQGKNRYEIVNILKPKLKRFNPSASGVYNICKRYGLNKLTKSVKENKRKIIKKKAGELGHVDCHVLPKDLILELVEKNTDNTTISRKASSEGRHKTRRLKNRLQLVGIIDSCTRVVWCEVIESTKSLDVMFATLQALNIVSQEYNIKYKEILTDNGKEFCTNKEENKLDHPFERLLIELDIKHRRTRPYRPQTNGKIERFWKTLDEELIEETQYNKVEEFKEELIRYLVYYNTVRKHSAINNLTPESFREKVGTK